MRPFIGPFMGTFMGTFMALSLTSFFTYKALTLLVNEILPAFAASHSGPRRARGQCGRMHSGFRVTVMNDSNRVYFPAGRGHKESFQEGAALDRAAVATKVA